MICKLQKYIVRHGTTIKISMKYDILFIFIWIGYFKLRLQTNGKELPVPRVINLDVFLNHEIYRGDENNVLLFPFSQSLAHDISDMPNHVLTEKNGKFIFYDQLDIILYS